MFKKIIEFSLKIASLLVLKKYSPIIIGITGSVGKTSTKEAIYCVVRQQYIAHRTQRNENNEIGVPLSILLCEGPGRNLLKWMWVKFKALSLIIIRSKYYPEVLVLEFGANRPGDIQYLTSFIKPKVGVVTAIGEIPAHVEFFSGAKAIAREKSNIVRCLDAQGFAILNFDDDAVLDMKRETKAHTITYGFGDGADVRAVSLLYKPFIEGRPGVSFIIEYKGKRIKIELPAVLGKQQVYSVLGAYATGIALGINEENIKSSLMSFEAMPGRMRVIEGIKKSWIIDDSYNASPIAMHAALDTLEALKAKRKIAVLGDMREIGKYTFEAHQAIGDRAARVADILICVGDAAKIIQQEAIVKGLDSKKVFWFDVDALHLAGSLLKSTIKSGDIILVKASRAIHLEKIVKEIMAHPEHADTLLVH